MVDVYKLVFVFVKGGVGKIMMMVLVGNVVVWLCGDWVMVVDVDVDLGDLLVRFSECGGL